MADKTYSMEDVLSIFRKIQQRYSGSEEETLKERIALFDAKLSHDSFKLFDLYTLLKIIIQGTITDFMTSIIYEDEHLVRILECIYDFYPDQQSDFASVDIAINLKELSTKIKLYLNDLNTMHSERLLAEKRQLLEKATSEAGDIIDSIKKLKNDTEKKFAFGSIYAMHINYKIIYKSEQLASWFWVFVIAALGACFTVNVFYEVNELYSNLTIGLNLNLSTLAIPALRVCTSIALIISIAWCGRRYGLCRQQAIKYRHLATVSAAYELMMKALDDKYHAFVTQEAVRVLFPIPAPSEKSTDASMSIANVIDLVRNLVPKSSDNEGKRGTS